MSHFVSSESIFEIIGNYPIVDQFDVSYSNLQSGSYLDNYITGTMFSTFSTRGKLFDKLGVESTSLPVPKLIESGIRNSYEYQPFREKAGIIRNVKIFSENERFYDSLMPNIKKMIGKLGGQITLLSGRNVIQIGRPGGAGLVGHTHGFVEAFPFEPKFSEVERTKRIIFTLVSNVEWGTGTSIPPYSSNKIIIMEQNSSAGYLYWVGSDDSSSVTELPETDLSKILFGIGNRNNTKIAAGQIVGSVTGSLNLCSYRYLFGGAQAVAPIVRGWKYGVHDAMPHYSSCVFRRDRFGQFRDMLEQRLQPAAYNDPQNAPNSIFDVFEGQPVITTTPGEQQKFSIEYPVEVNFVQITQDGDDKLYYSKVNPTQTRSSNLSIYATSSFPFFDLERDQVGKNTTIIPDLLITDVEFLSSVI